MKTPKSLLIATAIALLVVLGLLVITIQNGRELLDSDNREQQVVYD